MQQKMPSLMRLPSSTTLNQKQVEEAQLAAARFKALKCVSPSALFALRSGN